MRNAADNSHTVGEDKNWSALGGGLRAPNSGVAPLPFSLPIGACPETRGSLAVVLALVLKLNGTNSWRCAKNLYI